MGLLLVVPVSGEGQGFLEAGLSYVAVLPDCSARCIVSALRALAAVLNHSPGSSVSAYGPRSWGVSTTIFHQGVLSEEPGMRGLCGR